MDVDAAIEALIAREGDYSDNPADKGGPTRYGVTEKAARAMGYLGDMRNFSREMAKTMYRHSFWTAPGLDKVAAISPMLAEELFDTGVNMGPSTAGKFLQRALSVLGPKVPIDGQIGPGTLAALQALLQRRGMEGTSVLNRMLNAQQSVRYIELAEASELQLTFEYGWQLNRVEGV